MSAKKIFFHSVFSNLFSGVFVGLYVVISCISFALLFTFPGVEIYLPQMVGLYLIGATIVVAVCAMWSSLPLSISPPQSHSAAILLIIGANIAHDLLSRNAAGQIFPTLFAAIALTTFLTGMSYFIFGLCGKGNLVRYVPYPVIAGFLAALGWVILSKSILVLSGNLHFGGNTLPMTAAAISFGIIAIALQHYYKKSSLFLVLFLATIILFYLVLFISHTSLASATKKGWFIHFPVTDHLWTVPTLSLFSHINWTALYSVSGLILVVVLVSTFTLLLNAISVEVATMSDLDFNHELRITGAANLLASMAGGVVGYLGVGHTALARTLGGSNRSVGLICAVCCLLTLIFSEKYLRYLPEFALFGILIFTGITLLIRWLYDTYFQLTKQDYLILVVIFLVIAMFGFLQGVLAGIILSIILFVIEYSQISVIKYALTGRTLQSNKLRSPEARDILQQHGTKLVFFKLEGHIFFGTAYTLLKTIHATISDTKRMTPIEFMVIDFGLVNGLDFSAVQCITRLLQLAIKHQFTLVFANFNKVLHRAFEQEKILDDNARLRFFDCADNALEWCEDRIVGGALSPIRPASFADQLGRLLSSHDCAQKIMAYFEEITIASGKYIVRQGQRSKGLYFIESGEVSIIFEHPSTHVKVRLRKMGAGNIMGEMGFYTNAVRAASIIAEEQCVLHYLSRDALHTMEINEPQMAILFHRTIIKIVAKNLVYRNNQIEALGVGTTYSNSRPGPKHQFSKES